MLPFTKTVLMLILQRLQSNKTLQVSHAFAVFALFICALPQVGPDFFVSQLQAIQPG
jgi:exportin-2 (importin alpha re-exporter)